jgi:hypothetical protein
MPISAYSCVIRRDHGRSPEWGRPRAPRATANHPDTTKSLPNQDIRVIECQWLCWGADRQILGASSQPPDGYDQPVSSGTGR